MVTFSVRCMRHTWLGTVAFLWALLTALPVSGSVILAQVASGIDSPTDIQSARDGSGRLFFVQQAGRIMVWKNDGEPPAEFLNISSLVLAGGERGLLGLAFHPDYRNNGFFYVNYTRRPDGATVVARYSRSANNPDVADPQSAAVLLTVEQPYANHNGGAVRFGPDGYLYIGTGDGGSSNDPQNHAQDLTNLLGKMLRIDVNARTGPLPYGIPPANPFAGSPQPGVRAEIWAYGLRNPWRFSFDRVTGDLFIGDVGQNSREEIDFVRAGGAGGMNFGWRVMEGAQCTNLPGDPPCNDPRFTFTSPIVDYDHGQGCSVTGGYLYRGRAVPELMRTSSPEQGQLFKGIYVFGDLCSGTIWQIGATAGGGVSKSVLLDSDLYITTFGEDENGEIYVADGAASKIYRLASTMPDDFQPPGNPATFDGARMRLPVVNVGSQKFNAALKLSSLESSPTGYGFKLETAELTSASSAAASTFDPATGKVRIPSIDLTQNGIGQDRAINVEMTLVAGSDPMMFSLDSGFTITTNAHYSFDTSRLTLPAVKVGEQKFYAALKLIQLETSPTGLGFQLENAELVTVSSDTAATFDPETGHVILPYVILEQNDTTQSIVRAEMELVKGSDPLLFTLISYAPTAP
ncbi:PQQ-dependent sugar dehydrogenase [Methylobacter sp. YRD-M1]|uniref:PQQ-dependent sugar dehydrogenase n=1 Tax=Methylobacter sp. YRD-M1 TaxID=2911520 RepID=UPI00227A072E|nr:PQQ-dependent sugar dehydrogenase [Methylobacter sp. YRD-M1]WAK03830.1 PQQ-dependent sugar dehydrogenase [Methylobacter sp. YRD-M1]